MINTAEHYSDQTAIVTGGLGFVGRNLVEGLVEKGAKVIVVDDCSNSSQDMPPHWQDKVEHIEESVTTEGWLSRLPEANTVFHLACKTLLECDRDPVHDNEVNAVSTLRILEAMRRNKQGELPHFVYTSSACVYGITPEYAINETYPTQPSVPYGISKLAGENYTRMYARRYGIPTTAPLVKRLRTRSNTSKSLLRRCGYFP